MKGSRGEEGSPGRELLAGNKRFVQMARPFVSCLLYREEEGHNTFVHLFTAGLLSLGVPPAANYLPFLFCCRAFSSILLMYNSIY